MDENSFHFIILHSNSNSDFNEFLIIQRLFSFLFSLLLLLHTSHFDIIRELNQLHEIHKKKTQKYIIETDSK